MPPGPGRIAKIGQNISCMGQYFGGKKIASVFCQNKLMYYKILFSYLSKPKDCYVSDRRIGGQNNLLFLWSLVRIFNWGMRRWGQSSHDPTPPALAPSWCTAVVLNMFRAMLTHGRALGPQLMFCEYARPIRVCNCANADCMQNWVSTITAERRRLHKIFV